MQTLDVYDFIDAIEECLNGRFSLFSSTMIPDAFFSADLFDKAAKILIFCTQKLLLLMEDFSKDASECVLLLYARAVMITAIEDCLLICQSGNKDHVNKKYVL